MSRAMSSRTLEPWPGRSARDITSQVSVSETTTSLEDLVWALDEPVADLSALGFMALSELATRHVTVALAGQGADELLGGYSRHRRAALIQRSQRLPSLLTMPLAFGLRSAGGRYERLGRAFEAREPVSRYLALRTPFVDEMLRAEIALRPIRSDHSRASSLIAPHVVGRLDDGPFDSLLYLDAQTRAGGRHASLFGPCLDGALPRGEGSVSRPPHRRVCCADPGRS